MTRFPRSILSGLITLALLPSIAQAIGFGELVSQSAIGEPFKAQFSLLSVHPGDTESCIRIARSGQRDGIPDLLGAQVHIRTIGGKPVAEVVRAKPVSDPILRVTLEETCNARLKRTYTLLLPMAAVTPPRSAQTAPAPAPASPRGVAKAPGPLATPDDLGGVYTLPRSASLNAVARALYPSSGADRRAFISALKHTNRGDRAVRSSRRMLPVGTTLILPTPAEVAQAREALQARDQARRQAAAAPPPAVSPSAPAATAPVEAASTPAQPAPETDAGDRLVLMGGNADASGLRMSARLGDPSIVERTSDTEREALRREQKLILAIDSQIVANLELKDRIARLEALQDALRAELDARAPGRETPPDASPHPPARAPLTPPARHPLLRARPSRRRRRIPRPQLRRRPIRKTRTGSIGGSTPVSPSSPCWAPGCGRADVRPPSTPRTRRMKPRRRNTSFRRTMPCPSPRLATPRSPPEAATTPSTFPSSSGTARRRPNSITASRRSWWTNRRWPKSTNRPSNWPTS
ncbi:hypothetical protein G3580_14720 [Nitrogeniibacter mangrovi]|uniref:FimV N-terminal domain-containing protein n=1 Tax=Nitrogeniibacter mangrovi TaxID=2016596 RepID=A0A6C1B949_9RHOO|nr:hypothetical protein [Nitrogeniibacter mangrovi]QID18764.1 hypothetical protein G3580_14720 [Nitrogeniibacter mangrovi]